MTDVARTKLGQAQRGSLANRKIEAALNLMERRCAEATATMRAPERRRYRVEHGMCPECGKEAAPYYLCAECRSLAAMTRMLNRMAERKIIRKGREGRCSVWSDMEGSPPISDFNWGTNLFEMAADDKRRRPRMSRIPVDLDETLVAIFRDAGKPLTMDEIYAAWGKLRTKRKNGSLANDMAAIIAAERRREVRAQKASARSGQSMVHA